MMTPARRRATDGGWLYRCWISLPLVDRYTGEWSLSRTIAAYFAFHTALLIDGVAPTPERVTFTLAALIVALAILSLAAAFGKAVFSALATLIISKAQGNGGEL